MAYQEQSLVAPFAAHCYDDAGQDGAVAHVTEAALLTHGVQSAVCFEGVERTGEPFA